jgi:CheY-like chemotaxis protein
MRRRIGRGPGRRRPEEVQIEDETASRLRVVLVDDDRRFRRMACRALRAEGVDVVAEVEDGRLAVDEVTRWHPDVVLVDLRMPAVEGIDVARRLRELPVPPVVVLISTIDADEGRRLARGLAAGYLPKNELSLRAILDLSEPPPRSGNR